ncbi:MAG: hypothetical protein JSV56_04745, partial [Methanomassiliicoccales archaeon]
MNLRNLSFGILVLLVLCGISVVRAQETVFERKAQEYLADETEGGKLRYFHERIWSWLERMKRGEIDGDTYYVTDLDRVSKPVKEVIHNIIRCWGTKWPEWGSAPGPPYGYAWHWGPWQSHVMLIWILLKYGDVIRADDRNFLVQLYNGQCRSRDYSPGNPNTQIADWVSRYIWCQDHRDIRSIYSYDPPPNNNIGTFSWEGATYVPGNEYNTFELSRDLINNAVDHWLFRGNVEFDSPLYAWMYVHCFSGLYEFAKDPLMKRKAKMMTDFFLLESVLDFGGNQWGGALGRGGEGCYTKDVDRFYWDVFWDAIRPTHEPSRSIFFSSYRIPDVIYDIGDLSDEPDNYYHINMEYNRSICYTPNTGKWNYVTKFYSLGGGCGIAWNFCIHSDDNFGTYSRPNGVPFRMWINTQDYPENVADYDPRPPWIILGEHGYQYKNAMLVAGSKFHYAVGKNSFDIDQQVGNWRFIKEGRTMVAFRIRTDIGKSGLEVAIEGADYGSFEEFKQAILANANLELYKFITSRGDEIERNYRQEDAFWRGRVKKQGESNFQYIWNFPFPRLQAVDY